MGSPHVIGVITCDVWRVPCVPCTEVFSRGICAAAGAPDLPAVVLTGRGLHASSCQLNVSTVGGIRGTEWGCQVGFRACVGVLSEYQGVPWGIRGCLGCFLCEKRLRLSYEVDESKPLPRTTSSMMVLLARPRLNMWLPYKSTIQVVPELAVAALMGASTRSWNCGAVSTSEYAVKQGLLTRPLFGSK